MKHLSEQDQKKIIELFIQNISINKLTNIYKVHRHTIEKILLKNGQHLPAKRIRGRKYSLDENVFVDINRESSYWIGFLLADGCVHNTKSGQKVLTLSLQSKDSEILDRFKLFLKTNSPNYTMYRTINNKENELKYVRVTSSKIFSDLKKYNIVPQKTHIAKVSSKLIYNIDFWRGMIDGDGCYFLSKKYNKLSINLYGTYHVCSSFSKFCKKYLGKELTISNGHGKSCYHVRVHGKRAIIILNILYKDTNLYLDRKYQKIKHLLVNNILDIKNNGWERIISSLPDKTILGI